MEKKPRIVQVQKAPKKEAGKNEILELLATLCYFYPQYTLREARLLPHKHVLLLLKVAKKQEAVKYYNFTQIAAAPHTKNGKGVENLSSIFKDIMNSNG